MHVREKADARYCGIEVTEGMLNQTDSNWACSADLSAGASILVHKERTHMQQSRGERAGMCDEYAYG